VQAPTQQVNEERLERVAGRAVSDAGAALNGVLVLLGGRLGLWRALAGAGPLTSTELAERSGVRERYVREWLAAQAASGHLIYDADDETFTLPAEQAMVFADEDSPVYMLGGYQMISSAYKDWPRLEERFRAGEGFGWDEHDPELFAGTETFFRPTYRAHLLTEWIPSLDGVEDKLRAGGKVADVGCGHGVSTTLIAEAFPQASVHGFDYHAGSIGRARELARERGVDGNTRFEVASADELPDEQYDLVCFFRLPARHGRPGGGAQAPARRSRRGRHGDAGRAVRGRQPCREPHPLRPPGLRGLDGDVHTLLAGPGGCARARSAGGGAAPARGRGAGRPQPIPARGRDAVQPRPGGAAVSGPVAAPRARAKLYGPAPSHSVVTSRLMLSQAGIDYELRNIWPGPHKAAVRLLGFRGWTVPALRIDGRRVQGTLAIAREIERLAPDAGLFPKQPRARRELHAAERFGHDELQYLARRVFIWAQAHGRRPRMLAMRTAEIVAAENREATEAWNGPLYERWIAFREIVTTGLASHGEALLAAHPPPRGARALDIGCGLGDTTLRLAELVGPQGLAEGVDVAARMIEAATAEAAEAGVANAVFHALDVQAHRFDGVYDYAFSRFGTMFFASPVAALRNGREALRPGAHLNMVVWRRKLDNGWLHTAEQAVKRYLDKPQESDEPTCGPGPFSMADADMVSEVLLGAGFAEIELRRHDEPITIGRDLDEAVACATALGPAGEVLRLWGDRAAEIRPTIDAALREALAAYETEDGVVGPASSWLVSASVDTNASVVSA
jgi:ubiquinone/menaquinone biosynthesis C-methylase UbiE/glutathione S-transferase